MSFWFSMALARTPAGVFRSGKTFLIYLKVLLLNTNPTNFKELTIAVGHWMVQLGIMWLPLDLWFECQINLAVLIILGNVQVTATLSLAAACSSAGVVVLYAKDLKICKSQINLPCNRFEISILFGFLTWLLISISSHVMFWILASV